ncbi:MAG TPA: putative toxin-antitoxin system toxin component, PIN family [Verrucomicrobiae bacterium]|jgi:putative PIN family toxin of toxin-antitoxin system
MKVVFDAGVVFSGAGWRGEAHRCLVAMAHRRVIAYASDETLKELSNLLIDRGDRAKHSPTTTLNWYLDCVERVEPMPLGKQRSRDAKDDPYLACALAAGATIIVTRDEDLLVLGKPFGIQIITPRELLAHLARPL